MPRSGPFGISTESAVRGSASKGLRKWPQRVAIDLALSHCSNEASRSDHRPMLAAFELGAPRPTATKEQLLERIEGIQRELDNIKRLIESL